MTPRVPTLPELPDLGLRSRKPEYFDIVASIGAEVDPPEAGLARDYAEYPWQRVRPVYRSGAHPAIELCVRRSEQVVVDQALGHADGDGTDAPNVPVDMTTPFVTYSASDCVTAFAERLRTERELLEPHAPIGRRIPEYVRHGKESSTIGQVLAHRSGVANPPGETLTVADPGTAGTEPDGGRDRCGFLWGSHRWKKEFRC
ncbi:serine hydrolase domain-containing protein [Nocardia sp. NPDC047038]|uniref:serine hydrolase domain-containing protein n=1 Tax=Nocardia sp. NPDC047038 TaxID=3154338 RepID=UPI0033D67ED1